MKADEALKPVAVYVIPKLEDALGRGMYKIVVGSTSFGLACMAATLQTLRRGVGGFTFQISFWTFVAFAVGLAVALLFWKMAARSLLAARVGASLLVLAGIGGFLYPLRFVPADRLTEITIGLVVAVCTASTGAFLLWRMKRFLDEDTASEDSKKGD